MQDSRSMLGWMYDDFSDFRIPASGYFLNLRPGQTYHLSLTVLAPAPEPWGFVLGGSVCSIHRLLSMLNFLRFEYFQNGVDAPPGVAFELTSRGAIKCSWVVRRSGVFLAESWSRLCALGWKSR